MLRIGSVCITLIALSKKGQCLKSSLLQKIEALHGDAPWGHVLDAGTGRKSLPWVASLASERWTAVTAQRDMAEAAHQALAAPPRENDRILIGNWADENFLKVEQFDTVLLDYFIGSVDAFAPYLQEGLIQRMAAHTRGALYVIGLEPYVPILEEDEVGRFVGDLGRLRDACQLLAGDRPYREYPAAWVAAQLQRAGMKVTDTRHFRIRYREQFLASQLAICEARVKSFADPALASAMSDHIEALRQRGQSLIEQHDGLPYGRDYVLRAQPGG